MERMNHDRHTHESSGDPSQKAGLCGMGVHDRRPELFEKSVESQKCPKIGHEMDLPPQTLHGLADDALVGRQGKHVPFVRGFLADHEARPIAPRIEAGREQDDMDRRAPDVEPGEEANDPNAAPLPGAWGGSHCVGVQSLWGERLTPALDAGQAKLASLKQIGEGAPLAPDGASSRGSGGPRSGSSSPPTRPGGATEALGRAPASDIRTTGCARPTGARP